MCRSSLKLSQGVRCCLAAVITDVGRSAVSAATAAKESLSCIVFGMCRMSTTAHYLYWTPLWSKELSRAIESEDGRERLRGSLVRHGLVGASKRQ